MPPLTATNKSPKATKPKAGKPPATPTAKPDREVVYPEQVVKLLKGEKALTAAGAKKLLKWESEKDYTTRLLAEQPHLKPEAAMFGTKGVTDQYGETFPVLLEDEDKTKVVCWNNSHNRPFDLTHAKKLAQVILNRQWRFNFENIIIGKTEIVESGQHRLVALILAKQLWEGKNKAHFQQLWPTEPTIETSIAYGADEEAEVLQTLDNVKPRSLSDIFYVSPLFADLLPDGRNECSRMLDRAVGLLWRRTHQGREDITGGMFQKYMTHTASMDFVTRHPKVLECVRFIFDVNKKRGIAELKLSPGQCAAMLYLMAAGETDGDTYRNANPPQEEGLIDFSQWKQARLFWTELGKGDKTNTQFVVVKEALAEPLNPYGEVVKLVEKLTIIARSWGAYLQGQPFGRDEVQLQEDDYQVDEHGNHILQLEELPTFGGLDFGEPSSAKVTPSAEVEQEKANIKAANLAALKEANRARKAKKAAVGGSAEADRLQAEIDRLQASVTEPGSEEVTESDEDDFSMEDDQPEG